MITEDSHGSGAETAEPSNKIWLEMILRVSPALQDAVSDFLISTLGRGLFIEERAASAENRQAPVVIHAYLSEKDRFDGAQGKIEAFVDALNEDSPDNPAVRYITKNIQEEDWSENWKAYFRPIRVGKHLIIAPSWEDCVSLSDDVVIRIDPGRAFGTGTHATTALVLEAMEELWRSLSDPEVLDVGTGTGILGIAAAKLGASSVLCLDIDPDAVEAARENVVRNGADTVTVVRGIPLRRVAGSFDVILANLDRDTLVKLSGDFSGHLRKGGRLIVSGILAEQKDTVREAFAERGLVPVRVLTHSRDDEWICFVLKWR